MEREALKLALKSLQTLVESHGHTNYISEEEKELEAEVVFARQAINAVRAALYAPSQEPDALTIAYQSGYYDGKKAALAQPAQEPVFGWIKQSELAQARLYGGSVNLWLEKYDCDFPVYTTPPQREWNAALDHAAERIGEIKAFGQATQDSFAVYIKGLKR